MKNDNLKVEEISNYIRKDFTKNGIDSAISKSDFKDIEDLKIYLTGKIAEMLDKNYEKLINTLYLIDVSEEKLAELFASANKEFIPSRLADLIIERQILKFHLRQKYKRGEI